MPVDSASVPPSLTIVVPVHNEASFLPDALPRLRAVAAALPADTTIILAENGSQDGTADVAEALAAGDTRVKVLRLPDPDYGEAMRAGFLAAGTDWVANVDIDYFSEEFLAAALDMADRADLVLASKRMKGADDRRSILRRLGTRGFNLVLRLLFGSRVTDTHGMKVIRGSVVAEIGPRVMSRTDLFDTELVIRAERSGHRIAEIPARVEELRAARTRFVGRIPRTLRGLWRIRRQLRAEARSGGD